MDLKETLQIIQRGTSEIINPASLEEKLKSIQKDKRPLRVKAGFDPTAPDIHLGHLVLLRKLRQFQDLGHKVLFLIGDFTAQIGDPTGKDQLRPKMDEKIIKNNAQTYAKQVFKILDKKKTEVVFNSHWLGKLSAQKILELTAYSSVAQMLARSDFKKRFEENKEISMLEFVYPLLQGYDSVHLKADIELGGTDQKFNLLMGRQLQETYGQVPQVVIMTPLLEGTDGVQKMSKSLDNYIGINEKPSQIFGKLMSINDELMMKYYECLTDENLDEVSQMHPKDAKLKLGEVLISGLYGARDAILARREFEQTYSERKTPENIDKIYLKDLSGDRNFIDILIEKDMVASKREYARLISQGSVKLNGAKINDLNWVPQKGVLKIGKHRFLRLE